MVYPGRQDLHDRPFYMCFVCNAYVGCHPGTTRPLGTLANAGLRKARWDVHKVLDPLWRGEGARFSRREVYQQLAEHMGLTKDECHVAMFDGAQCSRAILFCQQLANAAMKPGSQGAGP